VLDELGVEPDNEVFELLKMNAYGAAGIIVVQNNKLTKSLSTTYQDYGIIKVKRESISQLNRSITIDIDHEYLRAYQSQNVIGFIQGSEQPDSMVIVSAHYDHLGKMGEQVFFPGANDNASGVSMMLSMANYFVKNPPKKTMVFIAFGAEEVGLIGSKYFVENSLFPLERIQMVVNLDLMGTGSDGITVVNGKVFTAAFNLLEKLNIQNNYVAEIKARGKAANSDHYWFGEKGIPSLFIYARGGISAYHDIYDVAETLPLTKFEACFELICGFILEI